MVVYLFISPWPFRSQPLKGSIFIPPTCLSKDFCNELERLQESGGLYLNLGSLHGLWTLTRASLLESIFLSYKMRGNCGRPPVVSQYLFSFSLVTKTPVFGWIHCHLAQRLHFPVFFSLSYDHSAKFWPKCKKWLRSVILHTACCLEYGCNGWSSS